MPGTIPGERVLFRIVQEKRSYIRGELVKVLSPSSRIRRAVPKCPKFGICGGCQLQHIPYEDQVRLKAGLFFNLLTAKGLIPEAGSINLSRQIIDAADQPWSWRARARLKAGPSEKGRWQAGFYRRASRSLVPITSCPVLKEGINRLLDAPSSWLKEQPEAHASRKSSKRSRKSPRQFEIILAEGLDGRLAAGAEEGTLSLLDPALLSGEVLFYKGRHAPEGLYSAPGGFFQANLNQNEKLVELVVEMASALVCRAAGKSKVLELFSGAGNFTIPLAREGFHVTALEHDGAAIEMAEKNARLNNAADNIALRRMDAERAAKELLKDRFDLVLLDPPRSGAKRACAEIAASRVNRVIYVSCDPNTLVRDLLLLREAGFSVMRSALVDMFPQTAHMESVTLLAR